MSILRKIGRFFGKAIRKVGDVAGAVLKPISAVANVVAPVAKIMSPFMKSNPITMGLGMALEKAPEVLGAASQVAGLASKGGASLSKISR
jgi:hypothetical protein